jgi:hypothetical protein
MIYMAKTKRALREYIGEYSGLLIVRCKRHRTWIAAPSISGTVSNGHETIDQCIKCQEEARR